MAKEVVLDARMRVCGHAPPSHQATSPAVFSRGADIQSSPGPPAMLDMWGPATSALRQRHIDAGRESHYPAQYMPHAQIGAKPPGVPNQQHG